ncbi:MAG: hypothetical protein GF388_01875 [Candidatus Aegiribacteria sp.]|nr:hypothetical protein [Candidatus Aegiribacteria sp.]MBD3294106.1 hypothetical protein [Candidatus Fermentibacteria bacterium]
MKSICFLMAVLVPFSALLANETYSWDFQELPAGWYADPDWEFGPDGAWVFLHTSSAGAPLSNDAEITSENEPMLMPAGTYAVKVSITGSYTFGGGVNWNGMADACVCARAYLNGEYHTVLFDNETWDSDAVDGTVAERSGSVTFPASEGDSLYFWLYARASAMDGWANVMWEVTSLTVIIYNGSSSERSTWGQIKTL